MTDTKFGKAFKEYRDTNISAINWIIGLIIGEVGLVLGLNYIHFLWLIILQILFASFAILLATLIMYLIVAQASMELFSARLALENPKMSDSSFSPRFNTVSIIPGMLTAAPLRTDNNNGLVLVPKCLPVSRSSRSM